MDTFVLLCRVHGLPIPETEYRFLPDRKFRADYAWPAAKILVEQNGQIWKKGGHSSGVGLMRDYEKSNLAQVAGWRLLTFTPAQMISGAAVEMLKQVL